MAKDKDIPLTKQDLKQFAQGLFIQFKEMKEKPQAPELSKTALNHQYTHNISVLEKVTRAIC